MRMMSDPERTVAVISCTTFETVKVSDPILFYKADRAHIIYTSQDNASGTFYESLVDDIERQVLLKRKVDIIRHNSVVYRYGIMLKEVNDIIRHEIEQYGESVDIYVNISSGSAEYAAAAMYACMMHPQAMPFTVRVKEHNIPIEKYRELMEEGAPFGDAKSVFDPKMVETFRIRPPKEELIRYLAFFDSIEDRPYSNRSIMEMMEHAGVWEYTPRDGKEKNRNSPTMMFRRNVLEPLTERGWITRGRSKNRWSVTPSGRAILDIFCDDDMRSFEEISMSIKEYREDICRCMMMVLDNDVHEKSESDSDFS